MAMQLISGNLNLWGNAGNYETSPELWNIETNWFFYRLAGGGAQPAFKNNFFKRTWPLYDQQNPSGTPPEGNLIDDGYRRQVLSSGRISGFTIGKKYFVTVRVRCKGLAGDFDGNNTLLLMRRKTSGANPDAYLEDMDTGGSYTVTALCTTPLVDNWVEITATMEAIAGDTDEVHLVCFRPPLPNGGIGSDPATGSNQIIDIDAFEIFEYEEVEDPTPPPNGIEDVLWSRNPVTLVRTAAAGWQLSENFRLFADVRVEDTADSGTYVSKLKVDLPPLASGQVVFQVREAFRDVLRAIPPGFNTSSVVRLTDRIKRFRYHIGAVSGTDVEPLTLAPTNPYLVVLGGLSKFWWPDRDYFGARMITLQNFMSWAPLEKDVDVAQEDYLQYFNYDSNITTIKRQVRAYFTDGTNQTAIIGTLAVQYGHLVQLGAGPSNSGVLTINVAKTVARYEITLLNQADAPVTETRTYFVNHIINPRTRYFMFLTSVGGYETLRFTGRAENQVSIDKPDLVKFLPYNYAPQDGERQVQNSTMVRKTNMSSGYVTGPLAAKWNEYLQDFLLSPRVFDVTDGLRRPVKVEGGTFDTESPQQYERFIRFTYLDSYEDENFTPADIGQ